jgi:hypothetical protein
MARRVHVCQPRVGWKHAQKFLKPRGELDKHLGVKLAPLIQQCDPYAHRADHERSYVCERSDLPKPPHAQWRKQSKGIIFRVGASGRRSLLDLLRSKLIPQLPGCRSRIGKRRKFDN